MEENAVVSVKDFTDSLCLFVINICPSCVIVSDYASALFCLQRIVTTDYDVPTNAFHL